MVTRTQRNPAKVSPKIRRNIVIKGVVGCVPALTDGSMVETTRTQSMLVYTRSRKKYL